MYAMYFHCIHHTGLEEDVFGVKVTSSSHLRRNSDLVRSSGPPVTTNKLSGAKEKIGGHHIMTGEISGLSIDSGVHTSVLGLQAQGDRRKNPMKQDDGQANYGHECLAGCVYSHLPPTDLWINKVRYTAAG